jgi:D-alanine-D-alanine ligase
MNRQFKKVAVLKGGVSSEREVSLRSGAAIAQGLREGGYEVTEVDIVSREFTIPDGVEAVFVALHGEFGEDGVSFDKVLTRNRLEASGVPVPRGELLTASDKRTIPVPLVVKPPREGSSVGCHIVSSERDWEAAFCDAVRFSGTALVEEYIPGRELTVGIVERGEGSLEQGDSNYERVHETQKNKEQSGMESLCSVRSFAVNSETVGALQVLPVVEIKPAAEWYDYEAKYVTGETEYTVPAELDAETAETLQAIALKTFTCLEAGGFGRVDFRLTPEGRPYVLELNAIPGFTATSLLPKAAEAAGIGFSELCCRIMELAKTR